MGKDPVFVVNLPRASASSEVLSIENVKTTSI